jgi:hypothetical protein
LTKITVEKYAFGLSSSKAIRSEAERLVRYLRSQFTGDESGPAWTQRNFSALREYLPNNLELQDFPSQIKPDGTKERNEFLWDFIAYREGEGVFLVVESEQQTQNNKSGHRVNLKHDFEKLLYVRAPLKLMLCKTKNPGTAEELKDDLGKFASSACQHFDPGSILILYCRTSIGEEDIAFIWQSPNEPTPLTSEPLAFIKLETI